ncbi:MAG: hypothetical protein JW951_05180, partial [Lentisphaerae bacterium]|nr:hypothetical protein [Lentisphaerota bacterium]
TGFNCRPAFELDEEEGIDWLDEWEDTNRIPLYVEVTLYTEPAEEGGDPVAVRRAVSIPVAALCWAAELEDRRQERGTETQPEVTP